MILCTVYPPFILFFLINILFGKQTDMKYMPREIKSHFYDVASPVYHDQ